MIDLIGSMVSVAWTERHEARREWLDVGDEERNGETTKLWWFGMWRVPEYEAARKLHPHARRLRAMPLTGM